MNRFIKKLQLTRYLDAKLVFCFDLVVSVAASMGALTLFYLLLDSLSVSFSASIQWLATAAVTSGLMFYLLKTYRSIIRHSTLREISSQIMTTVLSMLSCYL